MIDKVGDHQYISFDIFDTVIRRSVAVPSDIFRLMESAGGESLAGFARMRMEAEARCREKTGRPVKLAEIYDELRDSLGARADELMAREVQMELDGCRPNEPWASLCRECIGAGRTVVMVSDMYLPAAVIGQMLDRCGIRGYKKLYVSCEEGARKSDGSLFRVVLRELDIRPPQLLHIGDNRRSDVIRPMAMGIRVRQMKSRQKEMCAVPKSIPADETLMYRTLSVCIENCTEGAPEYEKQGAAIFGPILLGFAQWLGDRLRQDGITDVYFMARDGYTMKQAFDILETTGFCTHYMYCSRRSFVVPMLWKHSSMEGVMRAYSWTTLTGMNMRRFLQKVGLAPEAYAQSARDFGIEMDRRYYKGAFFRDDSVRAFYETVREDVERNSRREYEALLAYIRSFDMRGTIAVVDIGYHGTMQNALQELLKEAGIDVRVKGYYAGLRYNAALVREGRIDADGYLYSVGKNEGGFERYSKFIGIFETLFLAPHGSVWRFELENGTARPVFEDYEYDDPEGQLIDEKALVRGHQAGALELVGYIHDVFGKNAPVVDPETAIYRLKRLGQAPTLREARTWGDVRFFNSGVLYLARPKKLRTYLAHPKALTRDFLALGWHIGFMRRLLLLPLPYDRIFELMRKAYHKNDQA